MFGNGANCNKVNRLYLLTMTCAEEEGDPFPVDDCLFADTFFQDTVYTLVGQELKIRQVFGASLGVAAPVWEAGLHLCCYFEEQSVELRGKRIIELGAGTGVVGILAARLGPVCNNGLMDPNFPKGIMLSYLLLLPETLTGAVVTLTDLPLVLPQLQANVSDNMPPSGWPASLPTVLPLSWGEDHMNFPSDWDLVLCADIIYLPETYPLLVETLAHLCKNGAVVYLSSKMREEHKTPGFYEEYLPSRFNVELVHRDDSQDINIYRASLREDQ